MIDAGYGKVSGESLEDSADHHNHHEPQPASLVVFAHHLVREDDFLPHDMYLEGNRGRQGKEGKVCSKQEEHVELRPTVSRCVTQRLTQRYLAGKRCFKGTRGVVLTRSITALRIGGWL